ncbi:hypothetical protein [Solwaraspora sp. WMMA2065]|uniref:hypothetical protein n=1 Tax=Solwaraspora sp. WMMA2065 TaxID=3015166 RepID=UPI00259B0F3D|nr:hypothetical protein [Solwaraspora sp. WMMA2065]WJK33934.1 hypothetical protein O7610_25340 [Solwaraspora sp. WMMA2065]
MKIEPDLVEYFRTMLKGDYAENDRLEVQLNIKGWGDFSTLMGIVFYYAVNHRLPVDASEADIVQFVAELRAAAPVDPREIDANAAERLVKAALDPDVESDFDPEMAGKIQSLTIMHVLGEGRASGDEIDAILASAVETASRL